MAVFFAEVFASPYGGAWAVDGDPKVALRKARSIAGDTARSERGSYVLEFPDDAEPRGASGLYGGWRARCQPVRVFSRNKLKATNSQILGEE